jgi:hypothetical protein
MKVSIYPHIKEVKNGKNVELDSVLSGIKSGRWQDKVLQIMKEPDKEKRTELKKTVPYFTASGTFKIRNNKGLDSHSGLIAIDFDEIENLEHIRSILENDPYTYALFKSVSGKGLCCLVKIDEAKHDQAFLGLQVYYWNSCKIPIDQACKDVSRPRFVSFDPDLFQNPESKLFKTYPKAAETKRPDTRKYLHTQTKFDRVMSKIDRDITGGYIQWRNIGFAIYSAFGDSGSDYFHHISSFSTDYDYKTCQRQWLSCCRDKGGITIASFYYYAKQAGVSIEDEVENTVERVAHYAKKGHRDKQSAKDVLKVKGIEVNPEVEQIIDAVFDAPTSFNPVSSGSGKDELNIDDVIAFVKATFEIKKNELSQYYENGATARELEEEDFNSYFLETKKVFEKITRELFNTIVFSNETPKYNPIQDYFDSLKWDGVERIVQLAYCITSDTGTPEYRALLLSRWLVGIVESIYSEDKANELMLILAGKMKTGKSEFFKRLLPKELQKYMNISALDSRNDTDDKLLLCSSLLIFNEEFTGNTIQDYKKMKAILSTPIWSIRAPYGKKHIRRKRTATLCATSNDIQVLNDPTGNRRFVVFEVTDRFDYERYNSIDKVQLFAELVHRYKNGYTSQLSDHEDGMMELYSNEKYKETSIEGELILQYLEKGSQHLTATMIKVELEKVSHQKLCVQKIGQQMKKMGFDRIKKSQSYGYMADWNFNKPLPTDLPPEPEIDF